MNREVCNPVTHAPQESSPISLCCQPCLPVPDYGHWALGDGGHRNHHGGMIWFVFAHDEMVQDGEVDVEGCAWFWVSQPSGG